jgi:eukaryotic-like serine/threonine-protein kinase
MLRPDTTLGSYRLISQIGSGGMGEVWKAEDTELGRFVAIKILPPEMTADSEAIARLRREARMAAQLNHPNIATIHAFEEAGGRLFIVMELVEGEPLSKIIKHGVPEPELLRIGRAVAEALAEAHAKGVIHRDIKPENIMVSGNRVKVLDFGIAKWLSPSDDAATMSLLTQQGIVIGTVPYMSPEQALGKPLDARSDIFSLGIVLYEAATGVLPFRGETSTDTMTRIIRDEPIEASRVNTKISPGLNSIIRRCLRKNRDERYATAADLADALAAPSTARVAPAASPAVPPAARRRAAWPVAVVTFLVVLTFAGVYARRHRNVAHQQYQVAQAALFNREFSKAIEQYQLALDQKDELEVRERQLARLGIAIALNQKQRAEGLANEINARWPNDPDLQRIRSQFVHFDRRRPQP